ncbi:MAG: hypothetical protein ACRD4H_07320, partial [Candidatus Acidiferrales bacterium]
TGIATLGDIGQSEPIQNSFFFGIGDYLQINNLDPSLQMSLYQILWAQYQLSTSSANPLIR